MIRRTSKYLVMASLVSFAAYANAGTAAVTPALAACSKALVETLAKTETLPAYTVKAPSVFVSDLVDPNAFTVFARHKQDQRSCWPRLRARPRRPGEIVSFKSIPLKS